MTVALAPESQNSLPEAYKQLLLGAAAKIAPTWPLDQMIAVNPFWEMRGERIETVSAQLATLASANLLMPKDYYLRLFKKGEITSDSLVKAAQEQGVEMTQEQLLAFLKTSTSEVPWHNIADLLDIQRDQTKMAWNDEIVHQISQFCAAHYQRIRPLLKSGFNSTPPDLYTHWLDVTRRDRGISIVLDEAGLHDFFQSLPDTAEALLAKAIEELDLDEQTISPCAHALLMDINGWASWVAYMRWQGNLHTQPRDEMLQLLAIRMAWELVIWRYLEAEHKLIFTQLKALWIREKNLLPDLLTEHESAQRPLWVWAKAAELSYQQQLNNQLINAKRAAAPAPKMQAAFCIDVRSEVMRRALEAQSGDIQTMGFAGFFGLPLEYQPDATTLSRPQLPGLLKPAIKVTEMAGGNATSAAAMNQTARWQTWSSAAPSSFTMVESTGWLYAFKMLKKSFFFKNDENPVSKLSHQPNWQMSKDEQPLSVEDKAGLAKGILHAMGLKEFAPTVLLVGHGSHTTNNLHAAGLDCGACGGQTGEVNVRVLAHLLNDKAVRTELANMDVNVPADTQFVAALHNTTTDHITCFNANLGASQSGWLLAATKKAQRERMALIDETLADATDEQLDEAFDKRSKDWSQVRPEWGLANNAAFIVAPRSWTKQVDLKGRSFLHDYQWQDDDGFGILELIMTAPMVVTNWINMQYNASVTDNYKYGSGNKLLHNAVGGNIGLFEGNGGDLRIGLSMQSIHNGEKWMHQPQRLAVYLAAPREPIEAITAKHEAVRDLIDNEWLYLLRWSDENQIERFYKGEWLLQH